MIKACAITDKGIEKVALLELNETIKAKGTARECAVLFDCKDYEELATFTYKTQSSERVMLLFSEFEFKDSDELLSKIDAALKKAQLKDWFEKDKTFRALCDRRGEHGFTSQAIEVEIGELVINEVKKQLDFCLVANMENPDTIVYLSINNSHAYLGIDFAGRDLSKRKYRIFSSPGIISAPLSYALVRLAGYKGKGKFVDFFCKSGVGCIEAALYISGLSVNHYSQDFAFKKLKPFANKDWDSFFKKIDKKAKLEKIDITGFDQNLRNIEASKKNSKLAGVDKLINFGRVDMDWLDTKLDKGSVNFVVSKIACPSKHLDNKDAEKQYKELFYQAEFVMKKKGRLALLGENLNMLKSMITPYFKLISQDELWSGKQKYDFVIIEKQ